MRLFSSGIISLDAQLRGGFPSGSVLLILEEPGAGAEIFSFHIVVEGLKKGERVLYVTTDNTESEIRDSIRLYFNLDEAIMKNLEILDMLTPRLHALVEERDAKKLVKRMRHDQLGEVKLKANDNYDRVIINNITYFIIHYGLESVLRFMEDISIISKQKNNLFVLLMTKNMFDPKIETSIKHQSDGVIELSLREVENEIHRRLKIIKLERYMVPKNILRYDLTDKGIAMESVMRVL